MQQKKLPKSCINDFALSWQITQINLCPLLFPTPFLVILLADYRESSVEILIVINFNLKSNLTNYFIKCHLWVAYFFIFVQVVNKSAYMLIVICIYRFYNLKKKHLSGINYLIIFYIKINYSWYFLQKK